MRTLFESTPQSYRVAIPLLNNAYWNPALHPRNSIGEFIYTDGGLHGRAAKRPAQAIPYRAGYRRIGPHLVRTDETPPNSRIFTAPDGQTFLAPVGTNFQSIYDAGKNRGYVGMKSQIWQYGQFDFQRNGGGGLQPNGLDNIFYSAYTNASNYAVGVYMNGAGANLWETLAVARVAADLGSKNAGSPALREWQSLGWKGAEAQKSVWNEAK